MSIFVSLVTYNSADDIVSCITALSQQSYKGPLHISVLDNGSNDASAKVALDALKSIASSEVIPFEQNFGFSAGHNFNAARFLQSNASYFLVLNPDVELLPDALEEFLNVSARYKDAALITPKLYRKVRSNSTAENTILDAAGMELTDELRHFDRGSNQPDIFFKEEYVFGGTGACLFFPRQVLTNLLLKGANLDTETFKVFPQLETLYKERAPLFDEGFFAYREDADLCWRANHLGIKTVFAPTIKATHIRHVLPTNRHEVSSILNGLSVRNRFLLQINNYFGSYVTVQSFLTGFFVRNLLVLLGVLLWEHRSFPYLRSALPLIKRAKERRQALKNMTRT